MQRIDTLTKAEDLFGPGKHGFKDGNPGEGILPTGLNAKYFNITQEEIASLVEWAGIVLNEADSTQLRQALIAKFQAKHAILTALAGLAGTANKLPYFTGADTMALATVFELGAAPLDSAALTGSPTAPTPAFGLNNNRIATMAALQAVRADILGGAAPELLNQIAELAAAIGNDPNFAVTLATQLGQRPKKYAKNALPVVDEGPIIVVGGDGVWEWSASAYYTGYRHPRCGEPIFGVTAAPRPFELPGLGGLFDKAAYPQLWGQVQESGLVVSQAQYDAELGAYWFVNVSATQFRVPNMLGPNSWGMFPRWAAGGVDADTANAIALGTRKLDTMQGHFHGPSSIGISVDLIGQSGTNRNVPQGASTTGGPVADTQHGIPRVGMETSGRFIAFYPRIHV
ncbi:tail fiber protein [Hylemonella gracilis str. Niagara R]|uniref:Tail fiber protein n=1 Tax=Hylemonella gracilis str. Niagara R TaxID=1458275 RepID=A0A016XIH1_9BURK|nr:hypothetical protein [Hylemonella gracilis]EYC51695.1 tail fiber protein [Hylemonella gracilis str. Niagara R]